MKKIIVILLLSQAVIDGFGQNNSASPVAAPFPKAMEAVLHDYAVNFNNISGELVAKEVETESYVSTIQLPGAAECLVTRYHSKEDITASWQAKMFRGEDFSQAANHYKVFYNHLETCYLNLQDGSRIYLKGAWEEPKEENVFTISTFRLSTTDRRYSELKIELELLYQLDHWAVNINVVSKKNDTLEDAADSQ